MPTDSVHNGEFLNEVGLEEIEGINLEISYSARAYMDPEEYQPEDRFLQFDAEIQAWGIEEHFKIGSISGMIVEIGEDTYGAYGSRWGAYTIMDGYSAE